MGELADSLTPGTSPLTLSRKGRGDFPAFGNFPTGQYWVVVSITLSKILRRMDQASSISSFEFRPSKALTASPQGLSS